MVLGQDPALPEGVTLEEWAQLDQLEGSRRAGRPYGWRPVLVYRTVAEARAGVRAMAAVQLGQARDALAQASLFDQLAERLADVESGEPIDLRPVEGSLAVELRQEARQLGVAGP